MSVCLQGRGGGWVRVGVRIPLVDVEVLLRHVDEVECDVDGHHIGPLLSEVSRLVEPQQGEDLTHYHRVRDVPNPIQTVSASNSGRKGSRE